MLGDKGLDKGKGEDKLDGVGTDWVPSSLFSQFFGLGSWIGRSRTHDAPLQRSSSGYCFIRRCTFSISGLILMIYLFLPLSLPQEERRNNTPSSRVNANALVTNWSSNAHLPPKAHVHVQNSATFIFFTTPIPSHHSMRYIPSQNVPLSGIPWYTERGHTRSTNPHHTPNVTPSTPNCSSHLNSFIHPHEKWCRIVWKGRMEIGVMEPGSKYNEKCERKKKKGIKSRAGGPIERRN